MLKDQFIQFLVIGMMSEKILVVADIKSKSISIKEQLIILIYDIASFLVTLQETCSLDPCLIGY